MIRKLQVGKAFKLALLAWFSTWRILDASCKAVNQYNTNQNFNPRYFTNPLRIKLTVSNSSISRTTNQNCKLKSGFEVSRLAKFCRTDWYQLIRIAKLPNNAKANHPFLQVGVSECSLRFTKATNYSCSPDSKRKWVVWQGILIWL